MEIFFFFGSWKETKSYRSYQTCMGSFWVAHLIMDILKGRSGCMGGDIEAVQGMDIFAVK
jgi:hypothetical protein